MTLDTNASAIAQTALLPKAVDTIHGGNALTMWILSGMKAWRGKTLDKTIVVSSAGNGGSFSGLDRFNTNTVDTKIRLAYDFRGYEQPVSIPGMEADIVDSSDASIDLLAGAIEEAANEMADSLGDIFYGTGTGNSNKNFLGLAALVDDGGEVATIGGQARATYTTLKANETDVGGALTLDAMATMYDSCEIGNTSPSVIFTTPTIWSKYEALAQPTISHNLDAMMPRGRFTPSGLKTGPQLAGEMGFASLTYRGTPVVKDEKATSGTMWFLNERTLGFYGLASKRKGYTQIMVGGNTQIEGEYADQPRKSLGFSWSGLLSPIDQYAEVGHILLLGNLVTDDPRRNGVLNTIS